MRLRFFSSDKPRERDLAGAFVAGLKQYRVKAEVRELCATPDLKGCDAACFVGVKSKRIFEACLAAGVTPIMFDKGYIRTRAVGGRVWEYWRISVGAHHPTAQLEHQRMPDDRWAKLKLVEKPWRRSGFQIVIAGSSAKYHDFYGLPDPTAWAEGVVREIREQTDRPIIYRPKPSWDGAVPIADTHFSGPNDSLAGALTNAWVMITHGSNASFEAALLGIPSIVLGNGVAKPISSTSLEDLAHPKMAKRKGWFANLAYFQWTEDEFRSGVSWPFIAENIEWFRNNKA
jgi:hypothetical protein